VRVGCWCDPRSGCLAFGLFGWEPSFGPLSHLSPCLLAGSHCSPTPRVGVAPRFWILVGMILPILRPFPAGRLNQVPRPYGRGLRVGRPLDCHLHCVLTAAISAHWRVCLASARAMGNHAVPCLGNSRISGWFLLRTGTRLAFAGQTFLAIQRIQCQPLLMRLDSVCLLSRLILVRDCQKSQPRYCSFNLQLGLIIFIGSESYLSNHTTTELRS